MSRLCFVRARTSALHYRRSLGGVASGDEEAGGRREETGTGRGVAARGKEGNRGKGKGKGKECRSAGCFGVPATAAQAGSYVHTVHAVRNIARSRGLELCTFVVLEVSQFVSGGRR